MACIRAVNSHVCMNRWEQAVVLKSHRQQSAVSTFKQWDIIPPSLLRQFHFKKYRHVGQETRSQCTGRRSRKCTIRVQQTQYRYSIHNLQLEFKMCVLGVQNNSSVQVADQVHILHPVMHDCGYVRCPCKEHGVGCLWLLEPNISGECKKFSCPPPPTTYIF